MDSARGTGQGVCNQGTIRTRFLLDTFGRVRASLYKRAGLESEVYDEVSDLIHLLLELVRVHRKRLEYLTNFEWQQHRVA